MGDFNIDLLKYDHHNTDSASFLDSLKVKLSLTKRRTKIINYAHTITEQVLEVKFAYADVNGNLKIHLHEQREGKYTFPFNSIDSLHDIFRKFGWPLPNNDVSDDEDV